MIINKLLQRILVELLAASLLLNPLIIFAQTTKFQQQNILPENNLCPELKDSVLIGFFNGVNTTKTQANKGKDKLKELYGEVSPQGDVVKYKVFYNYTNGFEDFVETFKQRFKEKERQNIGNRYELFFGALKGGNSWWDALIGVSVKAKKALNEFTNYYQAKIIYMVDNPLSNTQTLQNYTEHRVKLDDFILQGYKLLLIAHSQGNLFVNQTYDYAVSKLGNNNSIRVVHIAPASIITNGSHVLADKDIVINGLGVFGKVASWNVEIPDYFPKRKNKGRDFLGHGLLESYLNQKINSYKNPLNKINQYVNNAFYTLEPLEDKISNGFFTVMLKWDGAGDVDLHITEPNGAHVFYYHKKGEVGFLDLDNMRANGPEHYYASCDKTILQEGTYKIGVANFKGANGRTATVWQFSHIHYCQANRQNHPSQKPEGLMERMVLASSNIGDQVLDPFCGSGTTLRVCQQLKRNCVGLEINPQYANITNFRLAQEFKGFDSIDPKMMRIPHDLNNKKAPTRIS